MYIIGIGCCCEIHLRTKHMCSHGINRSYYLFTCDSAALQCYLPTYMISASTLFSYISLLFSLCLSLPPLSSVRLRPHTVYMTSACSVSVSVLVHGQAIPQSTWCQRLFALCVSTQVQPGQNHANAPPAPESAAPTRLDRKCLRPSDRLMQYRQLGLGTGTCSILLALHSVGASGSGTAADWAPVDTAERL